MKLASFKLGSLARILLALCVVAALLVLPGLPAPVAPIPAYAFFADGPYTLTLGGASCDGGFDWCGYSDFNGLGQIDALAIVGFTGGDPALPLMGFGSKNGTCGPNAPGWNCTPGSSFFAANGNPKVCAFRSGQSAVCDQFFGAGLWNNIFGYPSPFANSTGPLSGAFFSRSTGRVITFYVLYGSTTATATPTTGPTNTPNATQTAAAQQTQDAGQTQTQAAGQTQTAGAPGTQTQAAGQTQTAGPGATQTQQAFQTQVHFGGNLIRNWNFDVPPLMANSEWAIVNQVVQAPLALSDPINVSHLPKGSCGPKYWDMYAPLAGSAPPGSIFQDFQWPGGPMYVNFEAVTDSFLTYGQAKVVNKDSGGEYTLPIFSNGTNSWLSFKFFVPASSAPSGRYALTFSEQGIVRPNALVVDNVNVRTGFWGNDCPADQYDGTIPGNGTLNPTATPAATSTYAPGAAGGNVIQNCDFENGTANWTPNVAASLTSSGGATGPTWARLITLVVPIFPVPQTFAGNIYQTFNWPGGPMYTSFFLKDSSSIVLHINNVATGHKIQVFTSSPSETSAGWTEYKAIYQPDGPGQYSIEYEVPMGSSAGVDGVAVAPGEYATGGCATAGNSSDLATQAAANQTATAAASPTAGAATANANATETEVASSFETYVAVHNQTATANANQTGTSTAQHATQTAAAQQTSTAQGTPQPSNTPVPTPAGPPITATPTFPPPATAATPNAATQTQQFRDAYLTVTAIWNQALTQVATSQVCELQPMTQGCTDSIAATQTAQAAAAQTQLAQIFETARARQTATALMMTQAQATYSAGATQTALVATGDANQIATATQLAAQTQTQIAIQVGTQNAIATQHAGATQTALVATGDAQIILQATLAAAQLQTQAAAATLSAGATADFHSTSIAHTTSTAVAAATQTALATQANSTQDAAATQTAVGTVQAIATEMAQATATGQAIATQQSAIATIPPVPPRQEPGPYVDCYRPENPLWLASWIDYEFCRLMVWFVWSPSNSQQVANLQTDLGKYEPLGTLQELSDARTELQDQLYQYDWAKTGLNEDDTLLPPIALFFPDHVKPGLLTGNIDLTPKPFNPLAFVTVCSLKVGDIFGDAVAKGLCAFMNWLVVVGIMGWMQFLFDVAIWLAFVRYSWNLVTVTLPSLL